MAVLCQTTEDTVMSHPLTAFVPHSLEALLNSYHTQHRSAGQLTSTEIFFLSLNTTLHRCNKVNPVTLLPEESDVNNEET